MSRSYLSLIKIVRFVNRIVASRVACHEYVSGNMVARVALNISYEWPKEEVIKGEELECVTINLCHGVATRQRREKVSCVWKSEKGATWGWKATRFANIVLLINWYSLPEIRLDVNRPIPSMSTRSNAIQRARAVSRFLLCFIAFSFRPFHTCFSTEKRSRNLQ